VLFGFTLNTVLREELETLSKKKVAVARGVNHHVVLMNCIFSGNMAFNEALECLAEHYIIARHKQH